MLVQKYYCNKKKAEQGYIRKRKMAQIVWFLYINCIIVTMF